MDPSKQLFQLEWTPDGDGLVAHVDLPNGPVVVMVGSSKDKVQPAPGVDPIEITRWGFAVLRDGHRLSSGQGTNIAQAGIFRSAYKAVLRIAAMESVVGACNTCGEHTYPQQDPMKNGAVPGKDDRIVCPVCKNDHRARVECRTCFTLGYLYRPGVPGDLRCIDKQCASRKSA